MSPAAQQAVHEIGTRPLVVSLLAQAVVLFVAVKTRDRALTAQSLIVGAGLLLVIESINLRPPSPPDTLPDWLGLVAACLFVVPAVEAVKKLRGGQDKNG